MAPPFRLLLFSRQTRRLSLAFLRLVGLFGEIVYGLVATARHLWEEWVPSLMELLGTV